MLNLKLSIEDYPWSHVMVVKTRSSASQSVSGLWSVMAVKIISNDSDFTKHIKANKFVLAIFVEDNSVLEVRNQK